MGVKGGKIMKKTTRIILLSAGILLSITGCEKGPRGEKGGKSVNLNVVTMESEPSTRTAYSGEGTWVDANDHSKGLSWERINWSVGDEILIWGTNVTVRNEGEHPDYDGATNIATYTVSGVSKKNDTQSLATISDNNGLGLRYDDGASSYTFWGIYPAGAVVGESAPTGSTVSYAISGTQTNGTSGPDMQQAVMLSVLEGASPVGTNTMEFYPAFTTYQFDITTKTDDSFTLKRVKISSANGTTALCGTVTATIAASGASTYAVSDGGSSITCTPETALAISNTQHAVVTILASPNGSEGLKVSFVLGKGDTEIVRTATLKKSGSVMSFAGCKKHVIKGIIVPTDAYFDKITLRLQVQGWDEYVIADAAASDNVQTTQFVVSGQGVKNGRDDMNQGSAYRQYWYFAPDGVVTVSFKVMLPENGTWSVTPVDPDGVFEVKNVSSGATSATTLSGPIGDTGSTVVTLEIRYTGTDSSRHQLYLQTFATKGGNTYSLDSETQLYDIRGYHYFVVNDPAYN
jgi:hypothetical protein